jgi:hypothetical protein
MNVHFTAVEPLSRVLWSTWSSWCRFLRCFGSRSGWDSITKWGTEQGMKRYCIMLYLCFFDFINIPRPSKKYLHNPKLSNPTNNRLGHVWNMIWPIEHDYVGVPCQFVGEPKRLASDLAQSDEAGDSNNSEPPATRSSCQGGYERWQFWCKHHWIQDGKQLIAIITFQMETIN